MKNMKSILFLALAFGTLSSCTEEDAYEIPTFKKVIFEENFNSNASISLSQIYKATGNTYNNNSTTLNGITAVNASSIKLTTAVGTKVFASSTVTILTPASTTNGYKVVLSYVDSTGATVTLPGLISKYNGTGIVANALSFAVMNSDYNAFTGDAYLLVFPGSESVFTSSPNATVNSTNPTIDNVLNNKALVGAGWNVHTQQGSKFWTKGVFSDDAYATFTSFGSGDAVNVSWLISPEIDMDQQEGEKIHFQTTHNFLTHRDNPIELLVSTDYDGVNFNNASWVKLDAKMVSPDDPKFIWVNSGAVDLSKFNGKLHFAFRVTGSGTNTNLDATYEVDNIRVYN